MRSSGLSKRVVCRLETKTQLPFIAASNVYVRQSAPGAAASLSSRHGIASAANPRARPDEAGEAAPRCAGLAWLFAAGSSDLHGLVPGDRLRTSLRLPEVRAAARAGLDHPGALAAAAGRRAPGAHVTFLRQQRPESAAWAPGTVVHFKMAHPASSSPL